MRLQSHPQGSGCGNLDKTWRRSLFFMIFSAQTLFSQDKSIEDLLLSDRALLLETCGVLSAQGVYITYTAIGTLADAYIYGVYDDETTAGILSEYILLSEGVNEQLNVVLKTGNLNSDDIGFVVGLNNIYELLISEADAFNLIYDKWNDIWTRSKPS